MAIFIEIRYPDQSATVAMFEHPENGWYIRHTAMNRLGENVLPYEFEQIAPALKTAMEQPYTAIIVFAEDLIFRAAAPECKTNVHDMIVPVCAFDAFSGEFVRDRIPVAALIPIVMLCLGGDEIAEATEYYPIAEAVVKNWPRECRPMP